MKSLRPALVWVCLLAPVAAHAKPHLVSALPSKNATVKSGTLSITLTFDRELDPVRGRMMLLGATGAPRLLIVPPPTTPNVLTATADVTPGAYTVEWSASDKDDAAASGSIPFTVTP